MENLLDLVKSQAGNVLVEQASSLLNENQSGVEKALGAALPSLLGSMVEKGSSQSGAEGLLNMINSGGFDGSLLDNLGDIMGGGAADSGDLNDIMNQGKNILGSLMDSNKQSGLIDMISNFAGLKKSSMGSLLSMAAPVLLSTIGKQVSSKGMNAADLMGLLSGQTDFIKAALPTGLSGIGNLLGFSGVLSGLGESAGETAAKATATASSAAQSSRRWLPYVLGALALIIAIWWFTRGSGGDMVEDAASQTEAMASDAMEATKDVAASIEETASSMGENLKNWLASGSGDGVFEFQYATFQTGSVEINPDLANEINALADIMKANSSMRVEIAGHTDNTGDAEANKQLSLQRAEKIKTQLALAGVAANRIEAKGYGQEVPIASNDTEEGREKNRRVEIRVLSK